MLPIINVKYDPRFIWPFPLFRSLLQMDSEPRQDHRASFYDNLLARPIMTDSDSEHELTETEGLLGREDVPDEVGDTTTLPPIPLSSSEQRKAFFIRSLALLCACCLSIGSH